MERYRLIPHERGIAVAVPREHHHLAERVQPGLPIIDHWKTPFIATENRWGLNGALVREERKRVALYIADFTQTPSWKISASLNLLFMALNWEEESSDPLITIEGLMCQGGTSGYDMSARLPERTVIVTRSFSTEEHRHIAFAMEETARMLGVDTRSYQFSCTTTSSLGLGISGDDTHLSGEWSDRPRAAKLSGHNIHTFWMQAAFLVGLTTVQNLVERRLQPSS